MNTPNAGNDERRPERLSDDDMPLELALTDDPDLRLRIGRYLGGIRKLKEITQEKVADDLHMSRPHLSNIEMGHSRTSWRGLRELARYYGYGMRALIEETQKAMPKSLPPPPKPASLKPPKDFVEAVKSAVPNGPAALSAAASDEAFLVGLMFLLDAKDRKIIAEQILQRVQARIKRAGAS